MDFGLTLLTHGVMTRDDEGDCFLQNISPEDMAPVESAVRPRSWASTACGSSTTSSPSG